MLIFDDNQPQDIDTASENLKNDFTAVSAAALQKIFFDCFDFQARKVFSGGGEHPLWVCWLDGMVNGAEVAEQILRPLSDPTRFSPREPHPIQAAARGALYAGAMSRRDSAETAAEELLSGSCAVLDEGLALCFQLKSSTRRGVDSPQAEKTVKGGKDAFVETLRMNTTLVRSRLHTASLKLRQCSVGRDSGTSVAVMWLDGQADSDTVAAVFRRLETMDTKGLLQADILQSALSDAPLSPFPQVMHTERPDAFALSLTEGKVGLLADGIPLGFLVPGTLPAMMCSAEDLSQHFILASVLRLLRWTALILAVFLPAFYVATAMYHQEMIPLQLLLSVIDSKQNVPFPTPAEVLGMLIAFELLQEAGLQLPDSIGQTVSIVGALIVGQSAVEARVISPIAVIVVALAGIAGYTVPNQDLAAAIRLIRLLMVLAAAAAGMFGLALAAALLLWHLCSLQSFGTDYMTPLVSGVSGGAVSALLRKPRGPGRPKGRQCP